MATAHIEADPVSAEYTPRDGSPATFNIALTMVPQDPRKPARAGAATLAGASGLTRKFQVLALYDAAGLTGPARLRAGDRFKVAGIRVGLPEVPLVTVNVGMTVNGPVNGVYWTAEVTL